MKKYKTETSKETITEAEKLAKANQRPGQTKEQTKLIALGIQKGIEQYKKKNKIKSRELSKKLKTVKSKEERLVNESNSVLEDYTEITPKNNKSPWVLLVVSWGLFALYFYSNVN